MSTVPDSAIENWGKEPRGGMGVICACHHHRELVPLEVHHVWPRGMGGPDIPANKVTICSNAHGSIHDYLSRLVKGNGKVPWQIARHYGRKVRAYALRGYLESRPK